MARAKKVPVRKKYGYIRVSSKSQEDNSSLETQKKALLDQGIPEENIVTEVGSAIATIAERPKFYQLIEKTLKKDDLLMITRIDRVARNTLEFLKIQDKLYQKSVTFVSLDLPYSSDLAVNKLIATTLAAIATFETERRKERQREGIEAAKKAGKYVGRKSVITPKLVEEVRRLKEEKGLKATEIAKLTGKCSATIYKILKQELGYIPVNRLISSKQLSEATLNEISEVALESPQPTKKVPKSKIPSKKVVVPRKTKNTSSIDSEYL